MKQIRSSHRPQVDGILLSSRLTRSLLLNDLSSERAGQAEAQRLVTPESHRNSPLMFQLTSTRVVLRNWTDDDLPAFARMGASPVVMKYFPAVLTREESDAVATQFRARTEEFGFGFWALEITGVTSFAGFVGLSVPGFESHFTPCVEIGWRLDPAYWGKGYATEAASLALDFAFQEKQMPEIVAFTAVQNSPSRRVMERLGMHRDSDDDFDHPVLADGHPLQRHVLYRISREEWIGRQQSTSSSA